MLQGLIAGGFALACAVGALCVGQPFRRSVLTALSAASLGAAVLSRLGAPHGPWWTAAAVALAVPAVLGVVALAAVLVADGVLLIRSQGAAPPQLAALAAGTGLAALAVLTVLTACCSGGRTLAGVCLVLDASAAYLALLFALFLSHAVLGGRLKPRRSADFVVVLGAGLVDGEVSPLLAGRLDRGLAVYRAQLARGRHPILITSGGQGADEERSEAEAMAAYLTARGVPADRIRREDRSRNTEENLANSARIMSSADPGYHCTVITSDFHAFRTALLMRRLGVRGSAAGAWTAPSYWLAAALREFVAVLWFDRTVFLSLSALLALPVLAALLRR
ncbi:YdcF family protein [Streptacidiphilus sp. PB12-B1b]|uniref:YdcF family protein n=1 Tax=Streptacidiphilus sp. PB12-B1b TaxID=2705012 RepID=UPI0015F88639|nr:YdcF family protein [Streptacidiphilus sp. PB12-B1b]QMU78120.1 YdcF family protein [Streptacidiphilus sp. PB12-B1b]